MLSLLEMLVIDYFLGDPWGSDRKACIFVGVWLFLLEIVSTAIVSNRLWVGGGGGVGGVIVYIIQR